MGEKQKGKEIKSKAGKNEGHLKWRERVKEGKWDEREHTKKNKAGKKTTFFFKWVNFFFDLLPYGQNLTPGSWGYVKQRSAKVKIY